MHYALMSHHQGRFHTEVECQDKVQPTEYRDQKFKEWLPENHRFVSVMWAGGWDEYVVDMTTVRLLTEDEKESIQRQRDAGGGTHPLIDGWLLGIFAENLVGEGNAVKYLRHLAGGD